MLSKIALENILFLDIETVPEVSSYEKLSPVMQELYAAKTQYQRGEEVMAEDFYYKAGIWAEFGKIICISVGYFYKTETVTFRLKSFYGEEVELLTAFKLMLETHFREPHHILCAHNGKEFDFPYIARRMIIHQISLPEKLQLFGKKPWEIAHLDTMELWKFGDYKHYTSLKLLTTLLGIPSPKEDIDGSQVAQVYYKEQDLMRIVRYCEADVIAIAQLLLRFQNKPILASSSIISVTEMGNRN
ncbi:MAG: 3'-5' exonuclease [Flavobacteriaceae bacterium]|nr:3'-5' exonuclease [Flavobacteriaceae bacterium]